MKTVAELNELRAANLKNVVLRKGADALDAAKATAPAGSFDG